MDEEITELLRRWQAGDRDALDELAPQIYGELRALARRALARRGAGGTLQPTVLVHEAFLRVRGRSGDRWKNRGHFFAVASMAMRHLVIDEARRRRALRRGGERTRIELRDELVGEAIEIDQHTDTLLALDQALGRLGRLGPRLVRVVECRFFAGLTLDETAEALDVTVKTVQRDWLKAQALLRRELEATPPG